MQPPGERLQKKRGRGGRLREGVCFFFKGKPTLASLFLCLGAFEYFNLSPSLIPSVVKMRDNLGCLLCLSSVFSLILFPLLFFV